MKIQRNNTKLRDISEYMDDPSTSARLRDIAVEHNSTGEALKCMVQKLLDNTLLRYEFEVVRRGR